MTQNDRDYCKQYYQKNKEIIREKRKTYVIKNKESIREKQKEYYENNKEELIKKSIYRRKKNYFSYRKKARERQIEREKTDVNYRIKRRLRNRMLECIKEMKSEKLYKTTELLGCSVDVCRKWLESKFLPGMTWDNHGFGDGKWHIDHIIPCASFDLTKSEEQLKCFHYTNLQPLWQTDNLSKQDKIEVLTTDGIFLV